MRCYGIRNRVSQTYWMESRKALPQLWQEVEQMENFQAKKKLAGNLPQLLLLHIRENLPQLLLLDIRERFPIQGEVWERFELHFSLVIDCACIVNHIYKMSYSQWQKWMSQYLKTRWQRVYVIYCVKLKENNP